MAGEEEKKEGKGFTVQDRRRFSETGDSREDAGSSTDAVDSVETKAAEDSQSPGKADEQQGPLPEINFSTFVISLSTQALMHLGEIANPLTGKIEPDRLVAKQMIDIIGRFDTIIDLDHAAQKANHIVLRHRAVRNRNV